LFLLLSRRGEAVEHRDYMLAQIAAIGVNFNANGVKHPVKIDELMPSRKNRKPQRAGPVELTSEDRKRIAQQTSDFFARLSKG